MTSDKGFADVVFLPFLEREPSPVSLKMEEKGCDILEPTLDMSRKTEDNCSIEVMIIDVKRLGMKLHITFSME